MNWSLRNFLPLNTLRVLAMLLLGVGVHAESAKAQLPTAELQALSRQAAQIGTGFELSLEGVRLEEQSQLIFSGIDGAAVSASATARLVPARPLTQEVETTGVWDIKTEESLADGLYELRSIGRFGISNPRLFLFSRLAVEPPSTGHQTAATAREIKSNLLINDRATVKASNFYRVSVAGGHRLRLSAYSKQLDALTELNVRLLDSNGQLITSTRASGFWPAELDWTNSSASNREILVEIRDLLYRGGPNFHYLVQCQVDAQDSSSNTQPLYLDSLLRPTLEGSAALTRFSQPTGRVLLQRGWLDASSLPTEPIQQFPVRFRGQLNDPKWIAFDAQKDQALSFEIASDCLDQLTDPAVVLYKVNQAESTEQLQQLAEQDDAPYLGTPAIRLRQRDPSLLWTAPETGRYKMMVLDRQTGLRPNDSRAFVMEIRPATPGFSLIVHEPFPSNAPATSKPLGTQIQRLGSLQLHVTIIRHDGFNGPIELKVQGLPAGLTSPEVLVPAGINEADLVIQAGAELEQLTAAVKVLGIAKHGEQELTSTASFAAISQAAIPTHNAVVARASNAWLLRTVTSDMAPLQVQLGDGQPVEVKAGDKFNLPIKLIRQSGSAAECILRPQALPAKVTLGETKIPGDKLDAIPEVTIAADAPVGEHTFWLQTETKVKWRANPQLLEREEQYAAQLKTALESNAFGEVPRDQIEAAITKSTARIEELKKQTAEQEYTIFLPSNLFRLRILPKS